MTVKVYIPKDAAAIACGADEVAAAFKKTAKKAAAKIEIVRNGSRGMLWLEPLVEVEAADGVRYGFGPVEEGDVQDLVKAGILGEKGPKGIQHKLAVGPVEDIPFFKKQTRLTFARCGLADPVSLPDYKRLGGYKGLENALKLKPIEIVDVVSKSGLRGRGGAGFQTGIKW